jgi:putative alpha-1,2-mannosidase
MKFKPTILALAIVFAISGCNDETTNNYLPTSAVTETPDFQLTGNLKYVNPFIGTGLNGHTFPGSVVPEGMIQLSPDTELMG